MAWSILFVIFAGFTLVSCPTQPTNPPNPATLSVEYTTCTEVWLRVTLLDSTEHTGVRVYRGDSLVMNFPVTPPDTVVIDTGLTPNTTYAYHTVRVQENHEQSPGDPLRVTTLPTTSHNFTWTIDTLGNYGSYLNDVAIVDEDDIWVAGNIVTDSMEYNAARWDGEQWQLIRIAPAGYFGPITAVYAFSSDDIWFGKYGLAFHFNGTSFTRYEPSNSSFPGMPSLNAIWGTSSSNLYFVGDNGSIVHYDGATFTRIESGHDVRLTEIAGTPDDDYVFIAGYSFVLPVSTTALMLHNGELTTLYYADHLTPETPTDLGAVSAVGVTDNVVTFVTYQGLWQRELHTGFTRLDKRVRHYEYHSMHTQGANDILLAGGGFKYAHFNGATWDLNEDLFNQYHLSTGSINLFQNTAVIVGFIQGGSHAIVARGRR